MSVVIVWILCGILGYQIAKKKKIGATAGAILGLILGVFGIIIILLCKDDNSQ